MARTLTSYRPGPRPRKRKRPRSFVLTPRRSLVAGLTTATTAPAMGSPDVLRTEPSSVIVSWASLTAGTAIMTPIAVRMKRTDEGIRMLISRKGWERTAVAPRLGCMLRRVNNAVTTCIALLVTVAAWAGAVEAQVAAADSVSSRAIAPGVTLRRIVRPAGPWVLSVLEVDLRRPDIEVRGLRACDQLIGRERPSAIARRLRQEGVDVVGVLNADFFDLRGGTGATESNVVIDGEIVKAVMVTESPFDAFDNVHTQFGITVAGVPVLDRFHLQAQVRTPSGEWPLAAINTSAPDALTLLTPWFDTLALSLQPPDTIAHVSLLKVGG